MTRIAPIFPFSGMTAMAVLVLPFIFAAIIKLLLEPIYVDNAPILMRPRRQFVFDITLYALISLGLFLIEYLGYLVPVATASKLIIGVMTVGYFSSIDNALTRERYWFKQHHSSQREPDNEFVFASLTGRMSLFLTLTVFVAMSVTGLVAFVDLRQLIDVTTGEREEILQLFFLDLFFVFCIVLFLTMRLIYSYSQNLEHIFKMHLGVLQNVEKGNLEQYMPVLTRDEFGLMASHVNKLIDHLKDKEQLRMTLERIVSPSIMEKLLTTDDKILKHGQEYDVAILFCDMREFTRFSENASAEDVIFFLNSYFSQMTNIVAAHHGIVNKFMGDAILAVYGLESNSKHSTDNAVNTAMAIIEHSNSLILPDGTSIGTGIGIHTGRVVAGTIGSEERYEYTFIGDAVNTASRLDGLTKRLGYTLVISADAYNDLGDDIRLQFEDLGYQDVRGKKERLHVYGAMRQPADAVQNMN
ncbi:MAG: adenylate/guanylate cyclase domain-containing protein [Granulosicoccaceae bacterium]